MDDKRRQIIGSVVVVLFFLTISYGGWALYIWIAAKIAQAMGIL